MADQTWLVQVDSHCSEQGSARMEIFIGSQALAGLKTRLANNRIRPRAAVDERNLRHVLGLY